MKKIMKWGICLLFLYRLSNQTTECETLLWYSQKGWNEYKDLIDVSFNGGNHFINTKGLQVQLNTFGTYQYPVMESNEFLQGEKSLKIRKVPNSSDPIVFSLQFQQPIQVGEVEFDIGAVDVKTQVELKVKVAVNVQSVDELTSGSNKMVYETNMPGRKKIDLKNRKITNLFFYFENSTQEVEYQVSYFQINGYQKYEHQQWVTEEIKGAEVMQMRVCNGTGEFYPDGTEGKWVKEAISVFSPSEKVESESKPILSKQEMIYDMGRGLNNNPYSPPNFLNEAGNISSQITGWSVQGERPAINFFSLSRDGEYIMIDQNKGVRYIAKPMYWSHQRRENYVGVISYNSAWCNHVIGTPSQVCYKHEGHSTNERLNVYDVQIEEYNEVVLPQFQQVESVSYYLNEGDREFFLMKKDSSIQEFKMNQTGRWVIKAILKNKVFQEMTVRSKVFLIDQKNPVIQFEDEENGVKIKVQDEHSGVKRWSYWISSDDGKTKDYLSGFLNDESKVILFSKPGEYKVGVFCEDEVGNQMNAVSNKISVIKEEIAVDQVLAPVYENQESNNLYVSLLCPSCTTKKPQEFKIKMDDKVIVSEKITQSKLQKTFSYIPNKENQISLELIINGEIKELIVYEKSRNQKQGVNEIDFEEIVVSSLNEYFEQVNYKEKMQFTLFQDKVTYFTGEGVDNQVESSYYNECASPQEYICLASSEENHQGNVALVYSEGAERVKGIYFKDNQYEVPLILEKNHYFLPQFFAHRKTGVISLQKESDEWIDAGRKWYTNPEATLGEYKVQAIGVQFGVNLVQWKLENRYRLESHYKDQYHIRFAETDNPFPQGISKLWENHHQWIGALSLERILFEEELEK